MLHFTTKGYLTPTGNILSDLDEFRQEFVINIPTQIRKDTFDKYIIYSNALMAACGGIHILQWINGSFTTKKQEPADIDLVSFIDHKIIDINEKLFKDFVYPNSEILYGVDAYIVKMYSSNERSYIVFQADRAYWMGQFGKTRLNRLGNRYPKGFLEIIY